MKVDRKKELARDFLALGSWVFYLLVLARALIKPYRPFVDQIIIAGLLLVMVALAWKNWDGYVGRGLVLLVFTSLFYRDGLFTGFAGLVVLGLIVSSKYTGRSWKEIGYGFLIGLLAVAIGYYLPGLF